MSSPVTPGHRSPGVDSDDSHISELSFDYRYNDEGHLVRVSRASGSTQPSPQSTPPTPPLEEAHGKPTLSPVASPPVVSAASTSSVRRVSLSRSQSERDVGDQTGPSRGLQRTLSVASSTPASSHQRHAMSSLSSSRTSHRPPQRVTYEQLQEQRAVVQREKEQMQREHERMEAEGSASVIKAERTLMSERSAMSIPSRVTESRPLDTHAPTTGIENGSSFRAARSLTRSSQDETRRPGYRYAHDPVAERMQQRYAAEAREAPPAYDEVAAEVLASPSSPTQQNDPRVIRPNYTHQRRDSETQKPLQSGSSRVDLLPLRSPAPSSIAHRRSPTLPGPAVVPESVAHVPNRHLSGKSWAAESHDEHLQLAQRPHSVASMAPSAIPSQLLSPKSVTVNRKYYARLDMIGRGGSSRVYRVMSPENQLYALKRVSLDHTEQETIDGYKNEIALLKRLDGHPRIIRLIDSEVKGGPKGYLLMLMECGEIDLAKLIQERQQEPMNMVSIAYYWQQMLQAVQVIHDEKIVHSDLKPANFVLVRGHLKLIDFGIANAIANDTTNIHREQQIGTVNYMSPEAIEITPGMRKLKVGRASDVWSLGCILYQMIYGTTPFHSLTIVQKMRAIPDPNWPIEFPVYAIPSIPSPKPPPGGVALPPKKLEQHKRVVPSAVIQTMRSCLCRNSRERASIPELLNDSWLHTRESPRGPSLRRAFELLPEDWTLINPHYMRQLFEHAVRYGVENQDLPLDDQLENMAKNLVEQLRKMMPDEIDTLEQASQRP